MSFDISIPQEISLKINSKLNIDCFQSFILYHSNLTYIL